jgi:FAD:protein FMN transferase
MAAYAPPVPLTTTSQPSGADRNDLAGRIAFPALGTTAVIVCAEPGAIHRAHIAARNQITRIDEAASRFRADSDLSRVNATAGRPVVVSRTFCQVLDVALQAAELTGGDLDPTIGLALVSLGYDMDFAALPPHSPVPVSVLPAPGWHQVELDASSCTVRIPAGAQLDLGATAKAHCADLAASAASEAAGCGVLVSLGGDVATAGTAPDEGWPILIAPRHDAPLEGPGPTVTIEGGGLATSGTTARRWKRAGRTLHHVLDPATGWPAPEVWQTVSVAAATCVAANIASTASIIRGQAAIAWLTALGLPARLEGADRNVRQLNGWPLDQEAR